MRIRPGVLWKVGMLAAFAVVSVTLVTRLNAAGAKESDPTVEAVLRGMEYRSEALGNLSIEGTVKYFEGDRALEFRRQRAREKPEGGTEEPPAIAGNLNSCVAFRIRADAELTKWWVELLLVSDAGAASIGLRNADGKRMPVAPEDRRIVSICDGEWVYRHDDTTSSATVCARDSGPGPSSPAAFDRCPAHTYAVVPNTIVRGRKHAEVLREYGVKLIGREEMQGHECVRLAITGQTPEGVEEPGRIEVWVAPERSFSTVRIQTLGPKSAESTRRSVGVDILDELIELDNGVWVPTRHTAQSYTLIDGKYLWSSTRVYDLTSVEVRPDAQTADALDWSLAVPIGTEVWDRRPGSTNYHIVGDIRSLAREFADEAPPPLVFE